jgi:hypothetical protein
MDAIGWASFLLGPVTLGKKQRLVNSPVSQAL